MNVKGFMERRLDKVDWRVFGSLLGLVALATIFWNTWAVYPLKILVVFLHELSHGLAALLFVLWACQKTEDTAA